MAARKFVSVPKRAIDAILKMVRLDIADSEMKLRVIKECYPKLNHPHGKSLTEKRLKYLEKLKDLEADLELSLVFGQ